MKYKVLKLSRFSKQLIAAVTDCILLPLLFNIALVLHFDSLHHSIGGAYLYLCLATSVISIPVFIKLGLYRAVIRYIDQKIILTAVAGSTGSVILLVALSRALPSSAQPLSYTPFLIYWALSILYVLASRFAARGYFLTALPAPASGRTRVAIYGAGNEGSQLATALRLGTQYQPVLFLDDNVQRQNTTIGGLKVYAPSQLAELARAHEITTVLLAMPAASRIVQREIIERLAPLYLNIKVIPSVADLLNGTAKVDDVRDIQIEDLLGRDAVAPYPELLGQCIAGKSVLVSGAGGSIGSELCRQIALLAPKRLVLFDISEYALYQIEQELASLQKKQHTYFELVPLVGSVCDFARCKTILESFKVDTIYHAAAYKHVPIVEHNPIEGVRNNVFGTLHLARAAIAAKVKCFVLISTDKAVRPTNVLGATKRLAELVLQAFARQGSSTRFSMVRFGNVLGSSGSVVPLFKQQILMGGPITLTHPDITRYFMTIPEAAQLVIQAGAMGSGGDVFVLDMGEPVRIADLAKRMVSLSGQQVKSPDQPGRGIEIRYIGLRPGEKLYEELLIGDNVTGTDHPLIMCARENEIEWPFLEVSLRKLAESCDAFDHEAVRMMLLKLVGEYRPTGDIADLAWLQEQSTASEFPRHPNVELATTA